MPDFTQATEVDPDNWVLTLFYALKNYVLSKIESDLYDVVFGFPSSTDINEWMPFDKTIIHLEIDDATNPPFGFGENIVDNTYDDTAFTVAKHEAQRHTVNWDMGVWASSRSGGVPARLRAFQLLNDLFNGASAYLYLRELAGIEILSYSGGAFIKEEINDLPVYRVSGITLVTQVFSRKVSDPIPYIQDIQVTPALTIDGEVIIDT